MRARTAFIVTALVLAVLRVYSPAPAVGADSRPNVFFYNLDDLRDQVPGGIDPLQYMPKLRQWMADGTRFTKNFVTEPSCCPSRSAMMTGRYAHNNGVRLQSQGPRFDAPRSLACYLQGAGYRTYIAGKFLTSWPRTTVPPCFTRSTVIWGGYNDVAARVDGVARKSQGYSTTYLGIRGREYIDQALTAGVPFLLYETPQAPHWVKITNNDGSTSRLAVPEAKYANAAVGPCAAPVESDRSDKPAYVRQQSQTTAQGQAMCESQLRAIMSADDQFAATMQLLADRGALANTLVIFSADNGYMWSDHGRTEKFVPYEPSVRVPLWVRWPGHLPAGSDTTRLVSQLDLLPTILEAARVTVPGGAPALDGESLLRPTRRTAMFAEYYQDSANGTVPTWKMVRTDRVKYVHTYNSAGAVTFREYYDLVADPMENTNLLRDGNSANDPPTSELNSMTALLNQLSTCVGSGCVR